MFGVVASSAGASVVDCMVALSMCMVALAQDSSDAPDSLPQKASSRSDNPPVELPHLSTTLCEGCGKVARVSSPSLEPQRAYTP